MHYRPGIIKFLALLGLILVGIQSAQAKSVKIIAISAVETLSDDSSGTASIDVEQGLCGTGDSAQAEPFTDTLLRLKIHNELPYNVRFNRIRFLVPRASAAGHTVRTKRFALVRSGEVPPYDKESKEDTSLYALFMDALGSGKAFAGESQVLASNRYGFKNVTIQLTGKTATGRNITITAKTALSFDNFDNCG